ncbi:5-formyltetrahydrofolate cyclo-ligase [Gracilibacillus sp. YIM 98692]|uniref:5-formyltetrahydrofolate cyclo-ligase n=1 Tax=Gracilibacillus sp. YIM 98692 TaxID=2663532 RepID=UPI0013D0340F|nr:5-formyltetrahydrofolate cyclo-ligase [Gracilibacillus sp. YIM 98692]
MLTKSEIRNQIMERWKKLGERSHVERDIHRHLLSLTEWREAKTIGITLSREIEWDTYKLLDAAWTDDKNIVVPKCYPKDKTMAFYLCQTLADLENKYIDLWEPIPKQASLVEKSLIDLMIVPGIAFDTNGYRIGYGGGYYDRYLKDFTGTKIALAATFQIVPKIEKELHDIPVEKLVTEQGVITCT